MGGLADGPPSPRLPGDPLSGEAPAGCKGFVEASGSSSGPQHLRILCPQNVAQGYPSVSPSLSATWGDCAPPRIQL